MELTIANDMPATIEPAIRTKKFSHYLVEEAQKA